MTFLFPDHFLIVLCFSNTFINLQSAFYLLMERREFIRKSCVFCMGGSFLMPLLESCGSIPVYRATSNDNPIHIPLDQFLNTNYLIVKSSNIDYNIAVIKNSETDFKSFVMVCTHAENMLRFNGKEFTCSLHGSIFDSNGKVEKGPAEKSLFTLKTTIENNSLLVNLNQK